MALYDELYEEGGTWITEIEDLLKQLPEDIIDDWNVFDSPVVARPAMRRTAEVSEETYITDGDDTEFNDFHLRYSPDWMEKSDWTLLTSNIYIRYNDKYPRRFDIDPDTNHDSDDTVTMNRRNKEAKYITEGTFVDPIVTQSVDRAVSHINEDIKRVALATGVDAEIERCSRSSIKRRFDEVSDDPDEFTDQQSPIGAIKYIGDTSIKRLSKTFGTYYNVTLGDRREIRGCLSSWRRPEIQEVIDEIVDAAARYEDFRRRDGWDRVDAATDSWTEYPKDQARHPSYVGRM